MVWQKKPELPNYAWADLVDLLRDYFSPSDLEWEAYRKIYGSGNNIKLIELNSLCSDFVMPTVVATIEDYVSGEHKNINWNYALAALVVRSCEEG